MQSLIITARRINKLIKYQNYNIFFHFKINHMNYNIPSITDVPIEDLKEFLTLNNQSIPTTSQAIYSTASNLINTQDIKYTPVINDLLAAYALSQTNITIPFYKLSTILMSNDTDLQDLANLLQLPSVDKQRIIRILDHLDKLNNDSDIFNTLPDEIFKQVFFDLDCRSMLLLCEVSSKFSTFCK